MNDNTAKPMQTADVIVGAGCPEPSNLGSMATAAQPLLAPPFDPQEALEFLGNDEAFLKEIIELFLKDLPDRIEEMKQAMSKSDAPSLRRGAHTVNGAASSLAAFAVCKAAQQLEAIGAAGDLTDAPRAFQELQHELDRLVNDLRRYTHHPAT